MEIKLVRSILKIAAGATLVLGMLMVIIPDVVGRLLYPVEFQNYHLARFIGAALIGYSVLNWFYSKAESVKVMTPAVWGNFVSLFIACLIDIGYLWLGRVSSFGWLAFLLHFGFAWAFFLCIFSSLNRRS
jgi:hypothetical protein